MYVVFYKNINFILTVVSAIDLTITFYLIYGQSRCQNIIIKTIKTYQ